MADDAGAVEASTEAPLHQPSKRRRTDGNGGELRRVAEIVMVLSAMGQMRGGRDPSPAERSLVAEARRKLVATCASLKPNDLFTSEAARVIAADLGFSHQVGIRPTRKVSIAEKVALTQKKMEEGKELKVQSSPSPQTAGYVQGGMAVRAEVRVMPQSPQLHQGLQRVSAERANAIPHPTAGFHTVLPIGHLGSNTTWKQMPFGEVQHSVVQMRPPGSSAGKDSPASVSNSAPMSVRGELTPLRSDVRLSGPSYTFQVQAPSSGNPLLVKSSSASATTLASSTNVALPARSIQVAKPVVQTTQVVESSHPVNTTQTFSSAAEEHHKPAVERQPSKSPLKSAKGNVISIDHSSQNWNTMIPSVIENLEIAKSVYKILQTKAVNLSGWDLPSLDYMSHPLNCQICKVSIIDIEGLLVCDTCDKGVHLRCLKSFNQKALANQEWHCPKCLLASNGRALPPKYGKVARSVTPLKTSFAMGGAHVSLMKKAETPDVSAGKKPQTSDPKATHERPNTGVKTRSSQRMDAPNMNPKSLELELDATVVNSNDSQGKQVFSQSIPKENSLNNDSRCEQPFEINRGDHHFGQDRKNLVLSPCIIKASDSNFFLDLKAESLDDFGELTTTGSEISNKPENALVSLADAVSTGYSVSSISMGNFDEKHVNSIKELEKTSMVEDGGEQKAADVSDKVVCLNSTSSSYLNEQNGTLDQKEASVQEGLSEKINVCFAEEKACGDTSTISSFTGNGVDRTNDCEWSSLANLQNVDWVGEAIEIVNNRSYYKSCQINDAIYSLQEYVLLPHDKKFYPSKLQALWEETKDGTKWAMVNRCYFPKDIPEAVVKPSSPVNNEVYDSNDLDTFEAGWIHGSSTVVNLTKFNQESETHTYLAGRNNASGPVFFCRWLFDKRKEIFLPLESERDIQPL